MEIEKLIERLQNWDGIKPDREIDCAIEGLKALQAENDRLRRERDDAIRQLKFFAPCAGCKWYRGIKGCAHELGCDTNHDYYEFCSKGGMSMERFTKKVDGVWTALCNYGSSPCPVVTQEIIDRLAAYEDTGFTPRGSPAKCGGFLWRRGCRSPRKTPCLCMIIAVLGCRGTQKQWGGYTSMDCLV